MWPSSFFFVKTKPTKYQANDMTSAPNKNHISSSRILKINTVTGRGLLNYSNGEHISNGLLTFKESQGQYLVAGVFQ